MGYAVVAAEALSPEAIESLIQGLKRAFWRFKSLTTSQRAPSSKTMPDQDAFSCPTASTSGTRIIPEDPKSDADFGSECASSMQIKCGAIRGRPMAKRPAVFLSYSREDDRRANALEKELKELKLEIWRDVRSIVAGGSILEDSRNG